MDAAAFHKTEAILDFIRQFRPLMTTAFISLGLISLVQPLDTAVNGRFKNLLQEEVGAYLEELEEKGMLPSPWTFKDRRKITTVIVGRAWERLKANTGMIKQAFLQCSIFVYPDGCEDYLINVKGVDNTLLDPNGWRSWSEYRNHEVVSPDFDHITALISATKDLNTNLKAVILKQLRDECTRRGISKSVTKPELLIRLQAHEAQLQKTDEDDEELTSSVIQLGTPIMEASMPGSPKAFDFPEDHALD
jgi:hypothetical protein